MILIGVSFSENQRRRHPFLERIDSKKIPLTATALIFTALSYGTSVFKDVSTSRSSDHPATARRPTSPVVPSDPPVAAVKARTESTTKRRPNTTGGGGENTIPSATSSSGAPDSSGAVSQAPVSSPAPATPKNEPSQVRNAAQIGKRVKGVVEWFNSGKGYGFIKGESGEDVFVHFSAIEMPGYRTLEPGAKVDYILVKGPKGFQAENVRMR